MKIEVINTRYPDGLPNGTIMTVTHEYANGTVDATVDGGDGYEWFVHAGMYRAIPDVTGTLAELNVKPGDVVGGPITGSRLFIKEVCDGWVLGKTEYPNGDHVHDDRWLYDGVSGWHIISRAPDDTPTVWQDMTDAEKGALLLANHEGRAIEEFKFGEWVQIFFGPKPIFRQESYYRIKPEPKRETVVLYGYVGRGYFHNDTGTQDTHRITFDTIDGEPDLDSIKMELIG